MRLHIPECRIHPPQRLEYQSPKHDGDTEYNILKLKNFAKTMPVPMVLYCDFETYLIPVKDNGTASKTVTKELHKPSGFSCLRVTQYPKYTGDIFTYSGPDVMDVFFNDLKEQEFASDVLSKVLKMIQLAEKSKGSTWKQRIENFVVIMLNMTKSDIMITLQDVTLNPTAIDETCNINSGKNEMIRNENQLIIMEAEGNSPAMIM